MVGSRRIPRSGLEKEKEVRVSHRRPIRRTPQGEGSFESRAGNAKRGRAPAHAVGGPDPEDGYPGFFPPGAFYHPDEHDRGGGQPTAVAGDLRTDPARVLETLGGDASGESEEALSHGWRSHTRCLRDGIRYIARKSRPERFFRNPGRSFRKGAQ